ncbi:hypothetical protein CBR_g17100 [Chara braunii]|uniref:Glutaredoxin domain-containing protein n=1 Tax=Chara braunii TaxID=69332 RepID=A0A388KUM0_CHABU|nr:hypothetical protein CBR_g17100 [Chara braunii]|eukprot:GBG73760.1 hypothetical protein CBR_g17100 [Chara braunii]
MAGLASVELVMEEQVFQGGHSAPGGPEESFEERVRLLLSMCYDDGMLPDELQLEEVVIEGNEAVVTVNEKFDEIKIRWLMERTVVIIFRDAARELPRKMKEDIVRTYENGWQRDHIFDPPVGRGRVKFEGPNVISYVSRDKVVADWMVNEGEGAVTLRNRSGGHVARCEEDAMSAGHGVTSSAARVVHRPEVARFTNRHNERTELRREGWTACARSRMNDDLQHHHSSQPPGVMISSVLACLTAVSAQSCRAKAAKMGCSSTKAMQRQSVSDGFEHKARSSKWVGSHKTDQCSNTDAEKENMEVDHKVELRSTTLGILSYGPSSDKKWEHSDLPCRAKSTGCEGDPPDGVTVNSNAVGRPVTTVAMGVSAGMSVDCTSKLQRPEAMEQGATHQRSCIRHRRAMSSDQRCRKCRVSQELDGGKDRRSNEETIDVADLMRDLDEMDELSVPEEMCSCCVGNEGTFHSPHQLVTEKCPVDSPVHRHQSTDRLYASRFDASKRALSRHMLDARLSPDAPGTDPLVTQSERWRCGGHFVEAEEGKGGVEEERAGNRPLGLTENDRVYVRAPRQSQPERMVCNGMCSRHLEDSWDRGRTFQDNDGVESQMEVNTPGGGEEQLNRYCNEESGETGGSDKGPRPLQLVHPLERIEIPVRYDNALDLQEGNECCQHGLPCAKSGRSPTGVGLYRTPEYAHEQSPTPPSLYSRLQSPLIFSEDRELYNGVSHSLAVPAQKQGRPCMPELVQLGTSPRLRQSPSANQADEASLRHCVSRARYNGERSPRVLDATPPPPLASPKLSVSPRIPSHTSHVRSVHDVSVRASLPPAMLMSAPSPLSQIRPDPTDPRFVSVSCPDHPLRPSPPSQAHSRVTARDLRPSARLQQVAANSRVVLWPSGPMGYDRRENGIPSMLLHGVDGDASVSPAFSVFSGRAPSFMRSRVNTAVAGIPRRSRTIVSPRVSGGISQREWPVDPTAMASISESQFNGAGASEGFHTPEQREVWRDMWGRYVLSPEVISLSDGTGSTGFLTPPESPVNQDLLCTFSEAVAEMSEEDWNRGRANGDGNFSAYGGRGGFPDRDGQSNWDGDVDELLAAGNVRSSLGEAGAEPGCTRWAGNGHVLQNSFVSAGVNAGNWEDGIMENGVEESIGGAEFQSPDENFGEDGICGAHVENSEEPAAAERTSATGHWKAMKTRHEARPSPNYVTPQWNRFHPMHRSSSGKRLRRRGTRVEKLIQQLERSRQESVREAEGAEERNSGRQSTLQRILSSGSSNGYGGSRWSEADMETLPSKWDTVQEEETSRGMYASVWDSFEVKCPPHGEERIVLYTTKLRAVRKTYEDCNAIRSLMEGMQVLLDERDISFSGEFREELRTLMGRLLPVPRVFIRGRYIGGIDEIRQLNEENLLPKLVEGFEGKKRVPCPQCGDLRYILCSECSGSLKLVVDDDVTRCEKCNENGMVRCVACL